MCPLLFMSFGPFYGIFKGIVRFCACSSKADPTLEDRINGNVFLPFQKLCIQEVAFYLLPVH